MDNRAVAIVLVVGILASMATFAFYLNASDSSDLPAAPAPVQATGLVAVEVLNAAPTGAPTTGGTNDGTTP